MKFDCLLTNPPYQDSSHTEKKNTLWRKWLSFNDKLVKNGGIFSLIIPSSWMGSSPILKKFFLSESRLKFNITQINRDECAKHFPGVGSTFSYFVLERGPYKHKTSIISKNIDKTIEVANDLNLNNCLIDVFPRDLSEMGISIIKKTITKEEKLGILNNTYNHSVHKNKWSLTQSDEFCHPIQNTPSKLYWYNYPHPHQNKLKLLIPTTTYYRKQMLSTNGVTQSLCYLLIDDDLDGNIAHNNVNNKLFDYLNECFRYANWNSVNLLRNLPNLPLNQIMTDEDIFIYFELNEDEINHINKIIKWR